MSNIKSIPRVSPKAREYVNQMLDFGFHNASSPGFYEKLESEFAAKFNRKYGILHSNGTATMHSALMAAGIGAGEEVIVPVLTAASTALVALYVNAIPVFADVDPDTFNISIEDIKRKITPNTRAVIPVAIHGLAPDMDPIMHLAEEHNLTVIEDDAQCFLGYYKGRVVGSIGHFASFSFQASKHMTCGDGGILVCDDEELALNARRAAILGYSTLSATPGEWVVPEEVRCHPDFARHATLGYNFRLPEIAVAVLLGELERLDELVEMRRAAAKLFEEVIKDCEWLIPQKTPEGYVHSCWSYACRITNDDIDWVQFRRKFVEMGGDGFYASWIPLNKEPVFQNLSADVEAHPDRYPQWTGRLPDYRRVTCPVWEKLQPRMIHLKTNYFDIETAKNQATVLAETIRHFS